MMALLVPAMVYLMKIEKYAVPFYRPPAKKGNKKVREASCACRESEASRPPLPESSREEKVKREQGQKAKDEAPVSLDGSRCKTSPSASRKYLKEKTKMLVSVHEATQPGGPQKTAGPIHVAQEHHDRPLLFSKHAFPRVREIKWTISRGE